MFSGFGILRSHRQFHIESANETLDTHAALFLVLFDLAKVCSKPGNYGKDRHELTVNVCVLKCSMHTLCVASTVNSKNKYKFRSVHGCGSV